MAEEKFAFESEEVSIAFSLTSGLGDCVIIKKVLEAVIELVPDCVVDIFYVSEAHKIFAETFYSDLKNLNCIWSLDEFYRENFQRYDLALWVAGSHSIILDSVKVQSLKTKAPNLLLSLIKIDTYNKKYVYDLEPGGTGVALRNMLAAQILNKNCYEFLSCDGALPIRDDKVNIPLAPEFKRDFESLKLDKYITIYTDINESEKARPKVKTYPIKYFREYISRMKKRMPDIEIVQCGGNDIKVENADRHFLGVDLELTKYILANSLLHVGCEGGLIHLATALDIKCLVLFGSSGVDYFGYKQNINLVSEICRPCAHLLPDATICLRGSKEPPCMLSHTPQLVCEITCNYLKNKA